MVTILYESRADIDAFIAKFGEDTYQYFLKSKQRLKNAGYTTDITAITKKYSPEDFIQILKSLDNNVSTKRGRYTKYEQDNFEIQGEYNYFGEKDGLAVYQPLDVEASMSLGVNTGWCTTGRYGHYGHPEFKPSYEDAKEHWDNYTNGGIKFYYFLDPNTMYGKYALAVYPKPVFTKIRSSRYQTNIEIYDAHDNLDFSIINKLPLDLVPEKIEIDPELADMRPEDIILDDYYILLYDMLVEWGEINSIYDFDEDDYTWIPDIMTYGDLGEYMMSEDSGIYPDDVIQDPYIMENFVDLESLGKAVCVEEGINTDEVDIEEIAKQYIMENGFYDLVQQYFDFDGYGRYCEPTHLGLTDIGYVQRNY